MSTNVHVKVGLCVALLATGCAAAQKKAAREPLPDEAGAAAGPADEMAVLKAQPKAPEVQVSEDQRAEFEKAAALYQKLKREGGLKGGSCDDAAKAFRRIADRTPNLLLARHNEAAVLFECGKRDDANRIWEELGRRGYAPALAQMGYNAWQRGDQSGAESLFQRAIQADPQLGSISARINLAQILAARGRRGDQRARNEAVNHLRAVLALDGNNLQAYATLCHLYWDLGLPDAAILIGKQATKRAEEIATGKFEDEVQAEVAGGEQARGTGRRRGAARRAEEEASPKRAKEVAVQGTGWTPEMKKHIAVVYNTLGLVELSKKRYSQAIGNFKEAVKLDPELYEARLNLAAVSLKFRDYVTSEENFRAVLAAQPRNYEAIIGLGVALRGNRKFDEAEQQYLAAQKLDPSRAESYFNLGLLYQEYKGNEKPTLQKAQQYYREFIGRADGSKEPMKRDAQKRIKDIDELFVALAEAEKLQREAEELQRKAEEQQKKMEEEMRKQEEAEKAKASGATSGGAAPAAAPPAAGAGAVAPPALN